MPWQVPGTSLVLFCVFQINIASGILLSIVAIQTVAFGILTDPMFLLRNLALCGAVLLVAAEDWVEDKSTFAGRLEANWADAWFISWLFSTFRRHYLELL